MTQPINNVKDAIRALHDHIAALGIDLQQAAGLLRNAVQAALEEITGSPPKRRGRPPKAASAVAAAPKAKRARKGKDPRGAKPGARQLKTFLGAKTYEALAEDLRVKGRMAIASIKAKWKAMSKQQQGDFLSKLGIGGASRASAAPKAQTAKPARKARKARAPKKAKGAAPTAAAVKDAPAAS